MHRIEQDSRTLVSFGTRHTLSETDSVADWPGANDNASGIAGMLEAARVLSKYKFEGGIVYAGLAAEEQGGYSVLLVSAKTASKVPWCSPTLLVHSENSPKVTENPY